MSEVSLGEFKKLCEETWKQRIAVDEISSKQKIEAQKLEALKSKVLAYMEHYELEKEHVAGFGTLSIQNRFSVKVPQGDAKAEFFEYLKSIGSFEDMATIHSATLNSWYQEKMDESLSQGNVDFSVPGIAEAKIVKTLGMRKG